MATPGTVSAWADVEVDSMGEDSAMVESGATDNPAFVIGGMGVEGPNPVPQLVGARLGFGGGGATASDGDLGGG